MLKPLASQSIGYILIAVKPGSVLISLNTTSFVSFVRKKSTLDNPEQSNALKIATASLRISSAFPSGSSGSTTVLDSSLLYFAS